MNKTSNTEKLGLNEDKGLFRTLLAGAGESLSAAFENLKNSPQVSHLYQHKKRRLLGARVNLSEEEGSGHWDLFCFNDELYVVVADYMHIDERFECPPGEELLEFHIKLAGHLNLSASRMEPIEVDGPSLLVWNQPQTGFEEWTDPYNEEKAVNIYCKPSFIIDGLLEDPKAIPSQLARFVLNASDSVNYCQLPLTPEIVEAASALVDSFDIYKGSLWLVHAEIKALELLCMIVTAFDKLSTGADNTYSAAELELFRQAREIVAKEFNPPPTIKQIAHRLGTNETKLKLGFKLLLGATISEYRHRCRMQMAANLLREGELPISMIAERVGYQHQATLTNAFKDYFGLKPKDYRKLRMT